MIRGEIGVMQSSQGGLLIAIGQRAEGSAGEEVVFDVVGGIFDASFFVGTADIASRRVEQIMGCEVQKAAVELDIGSYAGDDDALEIVIADLFGNPLEVTKGGQATGPEVLEDL